MWCHLQGVTGKQAKELSHLAFIPVANGSRLVPPVRLYARLRDDLAPFAFEVPAALAGRSDILRELGMKDAPPAADLISLLQVQRFHILSPLSGGADGISICVFMLCFMSTFLLIRSCAYLHQGLMHKLGGMQRSISSANAVV